jgi:multimeric flavodoxin WrbA
MKVFIFYESRFGNGKLLSENLKKLLKDRGAEAEAFSIREVNLKGIGPADFYVFSAPMRMFMLPLAMRGFIGGFKPPKLGTGYALMTTYLDPRVKALSVMKQLLDRKGMVKTGTDFKVKVLNTEGPLESGYEPGLEKFADEIISFKNL